MLKRELFVFAGQSNMQGACVYPAKEQIFFNRSYEYLHAPKRLGNDTGLFRNKGFPCGEFSYIDIDFAYGEGQVVDGKSIVEDYANTCHFAPSMCNLQSEKEKTVYEFKRYSEYNSQFATSLAPFIVKGWENLNRQCLYANISKGGVSITHYFNEDMVKMLNCLIEEYNKMHKDKLPEQMVGKNSADYFFEKVNDFLLDSQKKFPNDDLSERCFFWLQGETDSCFSKALYKLYLKAFWEELKKVGFTKFFCIRVGYWFEDSIVNIMQAQEEFCEENQDAYMLTRKMSFIPMICQDRKKWYQEETEDLLDCRDSFFGFENHHINEKGFRVVAEAALPNLKRVLIEGLDVRLEQEKCVLLKEIFNK